MGEEVSPQTATANFITLCEMTRQGQNPCETCGRPKQMYYKPWCPVCEKPEPQTKQVLNLIQCLEHIDAVENLPLTHGRSRVYAVLWQHFCDTGFLHNDSYMDIWPLEETDEQTELGDAIRLFRKHFKLTNNTIFRVSW